MSLEFKGTKGEWRVVNGVALCGIKNSERQIAITQGSEREANAKLIAAAPDLLEALQLYINLHKDVERLLDGEPLKAYNKAKQAIEKALK